MTETIHGKIPYVGAFAEAEGVDLTRIVLSVLPEGLPTRTAKDMNVVIEQIHIYPRQVTVSFLQADLNSDFNILFYHFYSSYIDKITTKVNSYTTLIAKYYPKDRPMWDEATAAILAY